LLPIVIIEKFIKEIINTMKHLHLIPNDKFTSPYIKFINENFGETQHFFMILGSGIGSAILLKNNTIKLERNVKSVLYLLKYMNKVHKIHIHGLFHPQLVYLLFLQPWLLRKCNWIIWGGDLYHYKLGFKSFKNNLYEFIRKFVIQRVGSITTHIKGDYELAKTWYNTRAKYFYSFMYPSNLYKHIDLSKIDKDEDCFNILVGNSADPTNNHLEVFEHLEKHLEKSIKIICPLSYGDLNYKDQVIKKGKMKFGHRFMPLEEFMSLEEYFKLLGNIDIAIFNHKRQQALGNITTLLSLGKKVYIREEITTWDFCEEHGLKVFSANNGFDKLFEPLDENTKVSNQRVMKQKFSEEKLVNDWKRIFDSGV
jgi:dTDP-N-acetylfucosamine:lipid II N-acetylfucosaminyltransferase